MKPWELYDRLISGIPEDIIVTFCNTGWNWTMLTSSEGSTGIAKTTHSFSVPFSFKEQIEGVSLKQAARLAKSWNFIEASIGVAAIGAYYNNPLRAQDCGVTHPGTASANMNVFELYREEIQGLRVAVIGHFPAIEKKLETVCKLTVLEREPQKGDLPDPACEYILYEQDYVFITGCTLVNKTLPRLLELSKNAKTIIVGPSTIISPVLFEFGVYGLSGIIIRSAAQCGNAIRKGNPPDLFNSGEMINCVRN